MLKGVRVAEIRLSVVPVFQTLRIGLVQSNEQAVLSMQNRNGLASRIERVVVETIS